MSEPTIAELQADVAGALRERDHWKRVAVQRGQTMGETLAQSTALLERAMDADRRLKAVGRAVAQMVECAEYSRRLAYRNGGTDQLALMAAECRERDVKRIRVALGEEVADD